MIVSNYSTHVIILKEHVTLCNNEAKLCIVKGKNIEQTILVGENHSLPVLVFHCDLLTIQKTCIVII